MNRNDLSFTNSSDEFAEKCIKLVGKYKLINGTKEHAILRTLLSIHIIQFFSKKIYEKQNLA